MKTQHREVHFFGGPLDGVHTTRFGEELRAAGAFRVEASHGEYEDSNTILDEQLDGTTISGGYDVWFWKED